MLTDAETQARLSDPPAEAMAISSMMFGMYFGASKIGDAGGAATWITDMVRQVAAFAEGQQVSG